MWVWAWLWRTDDPSARGVVGLSSRGRARRSHRYPVVNSGCSSRCSVRGRTRRRRAGLLRARPSPCSSGRGCAQVRRVVCFVHISVINIVETPGRGVTWTHARGQANAASQFDGSWTATRTGGNNNIISLRLAEEIRGQTLGAQPESRAVCYTVVKLSEMKDRTIERIGKQREMFCFMSWNDIHT